MNVTNRKINNVVQGSDDWLAMRTHPASELPMAAGVHKNVKRTEYLRMVATGDRQEFSRWVQENIIDRGHEYEAEARQLAEEIIDDELFPVTITCELDGMPISASLDGRTMCGSIIWEHKSLAEDLAQAVRSFNDNGIPLPEQYTMQMDEQLIASGAEKCLFMVSDGTPDNMVWCWYTKSDNAEKSALAIWRQFDEDAANYQHVESKPEPVGVSPESLPALHIELTGMVTASNLTEFRETAKAVIDAVNTDLKTDQDFANAEKAVKWCGDVEGKLEAAKQHALSQTASIDELFRAIDEVKEHTRQTRLKLDKLVKSRKDDLRAEIVAGGRDALVAHINSLNERIGFVAIPGCSVDFASAIKGMRSFDNMRDAVATALANAKIAANEQADNIERNLRTLSEYSDYQHLFLHDKAYLVHKDNDDLIAVVKSRIAEHKEAEREKEERIKRHAEEEARQKVEHEQRLEQTRKDAEELAMQRDAEQTEIDAKAVAEAEQRGSAQATCNDLVHRLRSAAVMAEAYDAQLMHEAADEIERLRGMKAA